MNDDELGRALSTALAAPEVTAAADAGARLRSRARRARRTQAVDGSVVLVLALLIGVGIARAATGGPPPAPAASGPAGGSRLTTPLTVTPLGTRGPYRPCTAVAGTRCGAVGLTVTEIAGLSTSELPERGAIVLISLTGDDAGTLAAVTVAAGGQQLTVEVGAARYGATAARGQLRIRVDDPRAADDLVAGLGAVPLPAPRTGPGRLDVPLQLWTVTGSSSTSCILTATVPDRLLVNRAAECLTLTGPAATIGSADLELVPPTDNERDWLVSVEPDGEQLDSYSGAHVGDRVAFVAGGHVYGGAPEIEGRIAGQVSIAFRDRVSAVALISRLRR